MYCTGRSVRGALASGEKRRETIDETAELITTAGGTAIPVRVDFTQEEQVAAFYSRVQAEQGRLDIVINDIWGG